MDVVGIVLRFSHSGAVGGVLCGRYNFAAQKFGMSF